MARLFKREEERKEIDCDKIINHFRPNDIDYFLSGSFNLNPKTCAGTSKMMAMNNVTEQQLFDFPLLNIYLDYFS